MGAQGKRRGDDHDPVRV